MKILFFILVIFFCTSCDSGTGNYSEDMKTKPHSEMAFDTAKWLIKKGKDYPFRDKMINEIVYDESIRKLNRNEIIEKLGEPTYYRDNKDYLYYLISQTRLFSWPLHTKTLVIKFAADDTIEWIKIHK